MNVRSGGMDVGYWSRGGFEAEKKERDTFEPGR